MLVRPRVPPPLNDITLAEPVAAGRLGNGVGGGRVVDSSVAIGCGGHGGSWWSGLLVTRGC